MIIFGFRSSVIQIAMMTYLCSRCGNPAAHALRKVVRKFTLFFIPLFPVSTKYSVQCTFCGAAAELTKQEVDEALARQVTSPAPAEVQPSPEEPAGGQPLS
ncbi:zinc ribbon domain-containing protein [Aeromicrobium sp.]|uniref:zinc ribbon domain-containing protein n=1 Tax=Aeromicrobium sp. TaxID=1871063 RepID=UPI0030BACE8A